MSLLDGDFHGRGLHRAYMVDLIEVGQRRVRVRACGGGFGNRACMSSRNEDRERLADFGILVLTLPPRV